MRFQTKIFIWMLGAMVAIVVPMLWFVESKLRRKAETNMLRDFEQQVSMVVDEREKRLESLREGTAKIAGRPNVKLALTTEFRAEEPSRFSLEDLVESAYDAIVNRKSGGKRPKITPPAPLMNTGRSEVLVMTVDLEGTVKDLREPQEGQKARRRSMKLRVSDAIGNLDEAGGAKEQQVGFMVTSQGPRGGERLRVLLATPVHEEQKLLGWFLMGFNAETRIDQLFALLEEASSGAVGAAGFFYDGRALQMKGLQDADRDGLNRTVASAIDGEKGMADVQLDGEPYRLAWTEMNPGSVLPSAYQIAFFPLAEMFAEIRDLKFKIALLGLVAVAVAAMASFLIARSLARPVQVLERATQRVRQGDYATRVEVASKDELGQLGESFNEMTEGLALKERYHEVLTKVSDEAVAQALMNGQLELGGETRKLAVLFCDIRGFTALTESMTPHEIITLLNTHMTAMTEVVYQHMGVVDKFVGDEIMAVFGAPKTYGDDVGNALRCALAMQERRRALNANAEHPFEIGIGVAAGDMIAGCMGSVDRLNYTVVGERVNLAARLAGKAGPGEILAAVPEGLAEGESIQLKAKGFSGEVAAVRLRGVPRPAAESA